MRLMASASSPGQYVPKLLGAVLLACALTSVMVQFTPGQQGPMKVAEKPHEHKNLMRREPKDSATHSVTWGQLLHKEGFASFASDQPARLALITVFASVALIGFAVLATGKFMQLMGAADVQKVFGVKAK